MKSAMTMWTTTILLFQVNSFGSEPVSYDHSSFGTDCIEVVKKQILALKQFNAETVKFEESRDDSMKRPNVIEVLLNHQIKGNKERCWGAHAIALVAPRDGGKKCSFIKFLAVATGDCRDEP